MIGIYKITNRITGDFYIGSSNDIKKRLRNHRQKGIHSAFFEAHITEFGWEAFTEEVIEECRKEDRLEREAYYIETLKPTYNVIVRGRRPSEETRKKISIALTGRKQSEETRAKRIASIKKRHETIPQTNEGHMKKVLIDGTEFKSIKDAERFLGVSKGYLSRKKAEKSVKCKGYTVRYVV